MSAYTLVDVARICRVPPGRLRYWTRISLVERRASRGDAPAFDFRDLVGVRALVTLLDRGVPLRSIRSTLRAVRDRMPDVDRPLAALRVWHEGSARVVLRREGLLVEPDGQLLLDFSPSSSAPSVKPLARPPAEEPPRPSDGRPGEPRSCDGRTASEWFERGCRLDGSRATYAEAIEAYQAAIRADPEFTDAYCNLGSVYFNQDRKGRARECFERALEFAADHVESNLNLATLLEEEGRYETALRHYKRALASDPLYADTHVSLGLLYEKLGLPGRARDHWRRYLQIEPGGSWADVAQRHLDS